MAPEGERYLREQFAVEAVAPAIEIEPHRRAGNRRCHADMAFPAMRPAVFTELFVIEGFIGFAHAADIRILHRAQARGPRRYPGRDRHRRLYDHDPRGPPRPPSLTPIETRHYQRPPNGVENP